MEEDPKSYQPKPPGGLFYAGWALLVLVVLGLTAGLVLARGVRLNRQTEELRERLELGPRVLVEPVLHSPGSRVIEVPGSIRGYVETPVYAKIAGYLKTIRVDKGDKVKKGQLLAVLDSPELDHQAANARATYELAKVTDQRNQALLRSGVIARQQADDSHAQLTEARASRDQIEALQAYKEIRAPLDAVVTARYVDPGALIPQSTTPTGDAMPILALATLAKVRVYADLPQSVAPFVRDGDPAEVTVAEYPGRVFEGAVTRHPEALTSATRTMLVEVDLTNPDRSLYPGMYTKIEFHVSTPSGVPMVPDDALVFRDGKPMVPVVRQNRLKLAAVTLGYDDG
ncbi:MAG TPA: efflux RND transporter periplasmic adaptor subunit, partial [Candidatus Binataceae bacterium]|nr:efflux RND transporter periplasmic adaptor subunit [Candidatus Binataceae bacterium]